MGKLISFNNNPVKQLRDEVDEKTRRIEQLQQELHHYKRIAALEQSTSDLLKLQVVDLQSNISSLAGHLKILQENLDGVKTKLAQTDALKAQTPKK